MSTPPPPPLPRIGADESPTMHIQRTGTRQWGPQAWEAWVSHGLTRYASEWGTYAFTRAGAERKARRLLRKYNATRRGPVETIEP
ncbi:MAG TPA: hypothetical protein VGE43_08510 [Acidimicrobiales bacterium]